MVGTKTIVIVSRVEVEVWDDDFDPDDLAEQYKAKLDSFGSSEILPVEGVEGICDAEVSIEEVEE